MRRSRRRGAVLIVVLGVLAVLALLAVTFTTIQATERLVARNYLDTVRARLVAQSGVETAVTLLEAAMRTPFPDPARPETRSWVYYGDEMDRANPPRAEVAVEHARNPSFPYLDQPIQNPSDARARPKQLRVDGRSLGFSGTVGGTYGTRGEIFTLNVRDLSGLIYVNDGLDQGREGSVSQNLRRILNRLGDVIACGGLGDDIVGRRPATGYRTPADLERALSRDTYLKARRFLTTVAWVDRNVANPVPLSAAQLGDYPIKYYRGAGAGTLYRHGRGVDARGKRVAGDLVAIPPEPAAPSSHAVFAMDELNPQWIEIVARAPININQAPREVLTALLADLQGFFLSYRRRNNIEPSSVGGYWFPAVTHTFSPEGLPGLKLPTEGDEYGFLYKTVPFKAGRGTQTEGDSIDAGRIAQEIMDCRERRGPYATLPFGGPFRTWRQFNAFCDNLVKTGVLEDKRKIFYDYKSSGADVVKPANITGFGPLVPSDYERRVASQALADVLKANFNPNLHLNELNPDANLHLLVDKTDLFVNSTEFIFTPTGYFEIESVGRVLRPEGTEDVFAAPKNETVALSKIVTGVQLFELYRETSQRDFSRGHATPRQGFRATNNDLSLEVGPEPDNGPAPLENEWDGYIALPTVGGLGIRKARGESLATPERPAERGESIGVHFQLDFDAYHHADGIREELSRVERPGEYVLNFPDPSETHGGPYNPLQGGPGHHRLARSFRMPSTSATAAPPALAPYGPLDLRVDGGYVERHAAPAWWISPTSFAPNMKQINIVASFWVKPSYPPDKSGKPRLMLNASRQAPGASPMCPTGGLDQGYLVMLYNAGHEQDPGHPSTSENMSLCGEPQWWDTNALNFGFAPFRPQAFIFGRGYGPNLFKDVPRYYASCQTTVNHLGHADADREKSPFREHRWTHVVLVAQTRPDEYVYGGGWYGAYDPPRWHRILVNGQQLKGTRETMLNQCDASNQDADTKVDFTVHRNGDRNSIRFGAPSQLTREGLLSGNFSCDATIDEFYLWNNASPNSQQKAVLGWLDGRYAKPLKRGEDPESSEGVFVSQEIELPFSGRRLAPCSSIRAPGSGPSPASTMAEVKPTREVIGISCTAYGEDAASPEMFVTDAATDRPMPAQVWTYLKSGGGLVGPFLQDEFSPVSLRIAPGEKLQYMVRFEISGLAERSILLTTPVVDDVTLYVRPQGGTRTLYTIVDLIGGQS